MNPEMKHRQKVRLEEKDQELSFRDDEPEMPEDHPGNKGLKSIKLDDRVQPSLLKKFGYEEKWKV